jgi:hypothetical protein
MPESMKTRTEWRLVAAACGLLLLAAPAALANDYPTAETVDYVIGCMAANGNNHEALNKCSCSIDYIAKHLPFAQYEKAETALGLQAGGALGGRVALFRDPPEIKQAIDQLRQTQAQADLQCGG